MEARAIVEGSGGEGIVRDANLSSDTTATITIT